MNKDHTRSNYNTSDPKWVNFDEVNKAASLQSQKVIEHLFPGGEYEDDTYVPLNATRTDKTAGTFRIDCNGEQCLFYDHATGDKGGTFIELWVYRHGLEFRNAAIELAEFLGIDTSPKKPEEQHPTAIPPRPTHHYRHGTPSAVYQYSPTFFILRFDKDGAKKIVPQSLHDKTWRFKRPLKSDVPHGLPLFNTATIKDNPRKSLVFTEGEKAALAAERFFDGKAVITCVVGGCNGAKGADYELVKGRECLIWPDNDEAGKKHGFDLVARLWDAGAKRVAILEYPDGFSDKWDAADAADRFEPLSELTKIETAKPTTTQKQNKIDQAIASLKSETNPVSLQPVPSKLVAVKSLKTDTKKADAKTEIPYEFIGKFPMTDTGNAERFADMHRDKARYCGEIGKWFIWDGTRWKLDTDKAVDLLATETARSIHHEVANMALNKGEAAYLSKWAISSESKTLSSAMISRARAELPIANVGLDANRMLLNVENGTIDLATGKLLPHNPKDLITRKAAVAYDPNAKCPYWLKHINWCFQGDQETIDYVQKAAGYSLTGSTDEEKIFILFGGGHNGKSTFIDRISELLGEYAQNGVNNLLVKQRNDRHTADIIALKGSRLVSASETDKKARLDEALIKNLTGTKLTARYMRQDNITFNTEHTIWLDTNYRPSVNGTDFGIWRRLKVIPFDNHFEEKDDLLKGRLQDEYVGILAWLVVGCLKWLREGLEDCPAVAHASEKYQSEENIIGRFIDDRCELKTNARVKTSELYKAYKVWCDENGERAESTREFGKNVKGHGLEACKGGKGVRFYLGISLVETTEDLFQNQAPTNLIPKIEAVLTPSQAVLAYLETENQRVSYYEGILDYPFEIVMKEIVPELEATGLVVHYPNVFELELKV